MLGGAGFRPPTVWRCFKTTFPTDLREMDPEFGASYDLGQSTTQMPMGENLGRVSSPHFGRWSLWKRAMMSTSINLLACSGTQKIGGFIAISHLWQFPILVWVCLFFSGELDAFFFWGVGSHPWKPKATKITKPRRKQKKKYEKQIEDWGAFYKSFLAVPLRRNSSTAFVFSISYKNHGETGETLGVFFVSHVFFCGWNVTLRVIPAIEESRCMQCKCRGPHVTWNELALYVFQPFFAAMAPGCFIQKGTLFDMSYATEAIVNRRFRWLEGHCFSRSSAMKVLGVSTSPSTCMQFLLSPMGNSI